MTTFIFANNIETALAGGISSASTSLTLSSALNLPTSIPAGSYLVLTLNDQNTRTNFEIVYVTAISGPTATVLRGQEGTAPKAWITGDFVFSGPTAGQMQNFFQASSSGVTPGSYGSSTQVGQFTVNSIGQITAASNVAIAFPITSFNGRAGAIVLNSGDVTTALGYNPVNKAGDTMSGALTVNSVLSVNTSGVVGTIVLADSGTNGVNIKFIGNGSTTPIKYLRVVNGVFNFINSAYSSSITTMDDIGNWTMVGSVSAGQIISGQAFISNNTNGIIAANGQATSGSGTIIVRPNGANNGAGNSTFTSAGGLNLAGPLVSPGTITAGNQASSGYVSMVGSGSTTVTGYVGFFLSSGVRHGYVGNANNGTFVIQPEQGDTLVIGAATTINGNLTVNGTISNTGTVSFNTTSDAELKNIINRAAEPQPLHRGAPWTAYYWLEDGSYAEGPIAQDVLATNPRHVHEQERLKPSGRKVLGIHPIDMALEQSWWCGGQIDQLFGRVEALEARL